jgi:hypothetical protein
VDDNLKKTRPSPFENRDDHGRVTQIVADLLRRRRQATSERASAFHFVLKTQGNTLGRHPRLLRRRPGLCSDAALRDLPRHREPRRRARTLSRQKPKPRCRGVGGPGATFNSISRPPRKRSRASPRRRIKTAGYSAKCSIAHSTLSKKPLLKRIERPRRHRLSTFPASQRS